MVPFAVNITGDPAFPHNGDVATNVTISSPTTWTESNYPGRVVKLNRLDVDDVLTLQGGPWFIFVETLDFGASGSINGDGPDGSTGGDADADYARGGYVTGTGIAAGGCGGVMILICANSITGTSSRTISANGGDAARNTSNAGANTAEGGQGALSPSKTWESSSTQTAEAWNGYGSSTPPGRFIMLLGDGGGAAVGEGGGSGGVATTGQIGGGGSGIGGGGGGGTASAGSLPAVSEPSVVALVELALAGCLGGGGGGAHINTTGTNNSAGGGGGGAVIVWARTLSATPTLSASGGAAIGGGGAGAAGVTYLIDIP